MSARHFDIDQLSKTTTNPEIRKAQALEYIAHYLELIEGHLARALNPDAGSSVVEEIRDKLGLLGHIGTQIAKKQ